MVGPRAAPKHKLGKLGIHMPMDGKQSGSSNNTAQPDTCMNQHDCPGSLTQDEVLIWGDCLIAKGVYSTQRIV